MQLKRNTHLHSREHLLADDLSKMMGESARFASYLGIAKRYDEMDLRGLARRVLEKSDLEPRNRGRYFFGALRGLAKKFAAEKVKQPRSNRMLKKSDAKTSNRH